MSLQLTCRHCCCCCLQVPQFEYHHVLVRDCSWHPYKSEMTSCLLLLLLSVCSLRSSSTIGLFCTGLHVTTYELATDLPPLLLLLLLSAGCSV
jgi:hypothetical protein